jgi:phosphoribosyl-AMP cyclohydrolase
MKLDFEKENGLIPAIVQDYLNGDVLMLGFMNREALAKTQETGFVTFFSRSRKKLWMKGESSGQKLLLRDLRADCDGDALLVRAELDGGAVCHEGYRSCFFRQIARDGATQVIAERIISPDELYGKATAEMKSNGENK